MFSLCFHEKLTAVSHWRLSGRTFHGPGGWIEVLDHPMVLVHAVIHGGKLGLALLEQPHPGIPHSTSPAVVMSAGEAIWAELRERTRRWPLHWFWIEADGQSLTIESSRLPTVPVFLCSEGRTARAHWDPLCLYPFLRPRLDWDAAAYYLATLEQPFSGSTLIEGLNQIAGGYQAHWRAGGFGWRLIPPASRFPSYPHSLSPKADPVHTFETIVVAATERLAGPLRRVAAGLSGGLDSTLVCGALARQGHGVDSFGILVPDEGREGQVLRRALAVQRFGLVDRVHRIGPGYSPWSRGRTRFDRTVPWEELYYEPFDELYAKAAAAGHRIFCTGLGGDDLLQPYWDELPDQGRAERAALAGHGELPDFLTRRVREEHVGRTAAMNDLPRAFVQRSVMDSAAGMAAQALRHGLWPVHPLIAPEVVQYCHALPAEMRRERRLVRDLLDRWGVSRLLSRPPRTTESFEATCTTAMRRCPTFSRLMRAPRLGDLGLVDPLRVQRAFRDWSLRGSSSVQPLHFVAIATLEATLESLDTVDACPWPPPSPSLSSLLPAPAPPTRASLAPGW
jgi:asparagine synthase (glutamine-hydrolysing)